MTRILSNLKQVCTLAVLLGTASIVCTPHADAATPSTVISLPEGTIEGSLPNGLRYIILHNDFPAKRAEFRLVWNIGAVQQDDTEGGCAHFLEHMAFGGSENFPDRGAVAYLESLGMKYGIDINAFTGHDRTIYLFGLPTDSIAAGGYDRPLTIISDWMDRLTINPQRVETEKGIILEELRSSFQDDRFYDLKIGQNRFSARMPLGTPEEVNRVTADVLEKFYRRWYLPQFATIVVVGDVEPAEVEKAIHRQFSSLKRRPDPGLIHYPLTYSPARQIMLDVDTLNNRETAEIIIPHPTVVTRTIDDARRKAIGRVVVDALSFRLADKGMDTDISDTWYLAGSNHLVLKALESRNVSLDSCVAAIASEISGVMSGGFSDNEIRYHADRAARRIGNASHSGYTSAMWCDDFTDYALTGDRYISSAAQSAQLQEAVRTITAAEATATLREWMSHSDTMLMAVSTSPINAPRRTLDALTADWQRGLAAPRTDFKFSEPYRPTADTIPTPEILTRRYPVSPSDIADTIDYASLGIRDLRLANGMRIIIKPTLDDGDVYFAMLAPGGYGTVPAEQLPLYGSTASYIDMGGIAKLPETTGEYMYQNGMALGMALENDWHGFLGSFTADKAGEFFNLVYEKITDPELRYDDFDEIKQSMIEDLDNDDESVLEKMLNRAPDRQLMARMDRLMCNVLPTDRAYAGVDDVKAARLRDMQRLDLDSIAAFYRSLYTRPDSCVVILTGNFDAASLTDAAVAAFSRLKAESSKPITFTELHLPETTVKERFTNENPSQTEFDYLYFGRFEPGLRNSLILKLMSNIMRNHVIAELREKRALVYSPYVMLNYEGLPRGYFYFDINSSSDNAKMPAVEEALRYVIDDLRNNPVDNTELESIKRACIIAKRETLTPYSPSAWRTTLMSLLKNGEALDDFDRYESVIESITPEEIMQSFRRYINPDLYVMLYMSDEQMK